MPEKEFELQGLAALTTTTSQLAKDAVDVLDHATISVRVQSVGSGTANTIYLQHAAVQEDAAFADTGTSWTINAEGITTKVLTDTLRFIRWRGVAGTGAPQFAIHCVAHPGGAAITT